MCVRLCVYVREYEFPSPSRAGEKWKSRDATGNRARGGKHRRGLESRVSSMRGRARFRDVYAVISRGGGTPRYEWRTSSRLIYTYKARSIAARYLANAKNAKWLSLAWVSSRRCLAREEVYDRLRCHGLSARAQSTSFPLVRGHRRYRPAITRRLLTTSVERYRGASLRSRIHGATTKCNIHVEC